MLLEGKSVLHIFNTATRFSSVECLDSAWGNYVQSVKGNWEAFLNSFRIIYTWYRNRLRTDQGSEFISDWWREFTNFTAIQLRLSGIQAHSSLGTGDTYHAPLRRIYCKIRYFHPKLYAKLSLNVAALTDTMVEYGLVPTRLVFGIIPRVPSINVKLLTQKVRLVAIKTAQEEMIHLWQND